MRLLRSAPKPEELTDDSRLFVRRAARGIILQGDKILLLYTARYDDYSLPGGGVDEREDSVQGLIRELREETGAAEVTNIRAYGQYDEYRPWHKSDFDWVLMRSLCYCCELIGELGEPQLEAHELQNGMHPVWMNIHEAIRHNEAIIGGSDKKGLSIDRETFLLRLIVTELLSEAELKS